jgi:hypothetical protein
MDAMGICDSEGINSIAIRVISCCFVIATRSDLREEFSMADQAFALSPISARAALPGEEDYAAISEAFMETARGRWFLREYAKRNRNADTSMVLDAVARIEQSLAAQKQESLAAQQQADAGLAEAKLAEARLAEARLAEARLADLLAAIRGAVDAAQASATEALDALALEQKLAPVRKGARVIREIAWRLREIGNDGRICDLIDSQVGVIEAGASEITSDEAKAALRAAFASIAGRLAEFGDDEAPAAVSEAAVAEAPIASPSPAAAEAAPAAVVETIEAAAVQETPEAPTIARAPETEGALADADAKAALAEAEAAELAGVSFTDEAADAHDEAMLDLIAQEMGAPDEFDVDEAATMINEEAHFAEPTPAESEITAKVIEPIVAEAREPVAEAAEPPAEMPLLAAIEISPPTAVESAPEPIVEISLGSSILASGIVRKPGVAANDPLAPIRRMSQAEKIAFFS